MNPSVCFLGRNGVGKCTGVELRVHERPRAADDSLDVQPLTSKGIPGTCSIEVPVAFLPAFAAALVDLHQAYLRQQAGKSPRASRRRKQ